MKLLVFSDLHSDRAALERLLKIDADYYFAAGDLGNWSRGLDEMGALLATRAPRVYVLPGNHESESDIENLCARYNLENLHGRSIELNGWHVAGLGYSNPTPFHTPGEYSEAQLAAHLEPFAALSPLILICHAPPRNTPLDRAGAGRHFGSTAVAHFLELPPPRYFFCGHIHEAAGVTAQLGPTTAVNAGKKGYLLEL